ncbi:MAG: hypothetical protein AAB838_00675 [Patescibacteria group bacterium]
MARKNNTTIDWADINIRANIMMALVMIVALLLFIAFKLTVGK